MRKAVFFDIDGTLTSELDGSIPESAVYAIRKSRENGNLMFINTGRCFQNVEERFRNIGLAGRIGRSDMGFFFLFLHSVTGRAHLEVCDVGLYPAHDCGCCSGLPEKILVGRNYYSVVHCPSDSIESHSDELLFHVCDPVFRGSVF